MSAPEYPPVRQRYTLGGQAAVEILAASMADGDDPPVPIDVTLPARHPLAIDEQPQCPGRLDAATPGHRVAAAGLPTLWRVDPVQP